MRSALRQGRECHTQPGASKRAVEDGDLEKSIKVSTRARGKRTATLRAGDKKAFYAHFIEYGVKPWWR